jgi:hypothetical protein
MNVTDSDYNDYMKYDVAIHNILDNFKNEPCRHLIDKIIHEN